MTEHSELGQDEDRAQRYARQTKLGTRLVHAPFANKIARSLAALEKGATIVDLGAGPGLLAVELHMPWPQARIIGVDPSNEMLNIARANAANAGISEFEAGLGSAEETYLPASSVDLVVSQHSFHEWADPQAGLREAFRILKPGGSLILSDVSRAWLSPWKRRLLGLFHPVDMFAFTFEQVSELLREAGFTELEGQRSKLQWFVRATRPETV